MINNKKSVVYNKKDLSVLFVEMAESNNIPLSTVFKHIAFLAKNKNYGNKSIDDITISAGRKMIVFDQNILRKLMNDYQAPGVSKKKFAEDFVEALWRNKEKKHLKNM